MNNTSIIIVAVLAIGAMLFLRGSLPAERAYTFGEASRYDATPRRRNCPPKPQYARSERQAQPRWERVEPETDGSVTTAFRYRGNSDE